MRAILWVETPGNGNEMDKVLRFIPENAEFLPDDVNSIKSWFEAGWKVYASGGITALELRGGGHQKGVTRLVTALTRTTLIRLLSRKAFARGRGDMLRPCDPSSCSGFSGSACAPRSSRCRR